MSPNQKEFVVVRVDEGSWLVKLSLRDGETGGMMPAMDAEICTDCVPPPVNGRVEFGTKRIEIDGVFCGGTGYIIAGYYEPHTGRGRITIEVETLTANEPVYDLPCTD